MEQDATMENLFDGLVTRSLNAGTLSHAQYDEMTDALAAARDESGRDALMLHLLRVTHHVGDGQTRTRHMNWPRPEVRYLRR